MIVVMNVGAEDAQIEAVIGRLHSLGFDVHRSSGRNQTVIGAIGVQPDFDPRQIRLLAGVAEVFRVTEPYKFASRTWKGQDTVVKLDDVEIGGSGVIVMAGPSMVESEEQINAAAALVSKAGVRFLKGSTYRSRLSPYDFEGHGVRAIELLHEAAKANGLKVVSQVADISLLKELIPYSDAFHVPSEQMHNNLLLMKLGELGKPVILTRGLASTIEEWLMSAESILKTGNNNVILCEGGIRTFEPYTQNTLDLSAIPVLKKKSHLPVFADPSQGTGIRNKVIPMARAAVAAGADGLIVELHPDPENALVDGPQSLDGSEFDELMTQIKKIAQAVGRHL